MATVNGNKIAAADGKNIAEFLQSQGYPDRMLAVECNGNIVPRRDWENVVLKEADTLEVVRFVGGG